MDRGHYQTTTVVPLGNGGFPAELMPFELSEGMAIRCFGQPGFDWREEVQPVFDNRYAQGALSPAESRNPRMAAGFLIGKFSFDVPDGDGAMAQHAKLRKIASYEALTDWAIWSLYLAGSGENVYWYNGNQMQGCGVYSLTVCSHGTHLSVNRFPFIYAPIQPPGGAGQGRPWADEGVLELASRVFRGFRDQQIAVPRWLSLVNRLYRLLTSIGPTNVAARLQLAVTALETFYIDGRVRGYLWDGRCAKAIGEFVGGCAPEAIDGNYFEQLRQFRNDAVHRAGTPWTSGEDASKEVQRVARLTEELLRLTLVIAVLNAPVVCSPNFRDEWDVGSLVRP